MRGIESFNFPAFFQAAEHLRLLGHEVWNPAERDVAAGFNPDTDEPESFLHYMQHDLPQVMQAEAIAVLPGWRKSKGARLETTVATECGIPVLNARDLSPVDETVLEEAQRLVHGDRGADYGHPIEDFTRTGIMWGAIFGIEAVPPEKVAMAMIAVKLSRECNRPKRDNRADIAGYAETLDMVRQHQEAENELL